MPEHTDSAQETRTERGTVMLTRDEKRDAVLVAAFHGKSESDVYREYSVAGISEEAMRIRSLRSAA